MGTARIMKQLLKGVEGGDYASCTATLREAQTILSPPNKQSESPSLGTDAFLYLSRLLLINSRQGVTAPVV